MEQYDTPRTPEQQADEYLEQSMRRRDVLIGAAAAFGGAAGVKWIVEEGVIDGGPDGELPDGVYNATEMQDYDFDTPTPTTETTTERYETPTPTTDDPTTAPPTTPETTTEEYDTPTPTTETTTTTTETPTETTTETTTERYETPTPRETTTVEEGCSIGEERVRIRDLPGGGVFGGGLQADAERAERRLDHAIKEFNHNTKWPRVYMENGPRYENDLIGEYSKSVDFYRDEGTFSQDRFDAVVYARTFEDGPYGDIRRSYRRKHKAFTEEIGRAIGMMLESTFNPDENGSLWPYTENLRQVDEPAIEDVAVVLDGGTNGYFEACLGPDQLSRLPSSEAKFRDIGRDLISKETIHDGDYPRTSIAADAVNDAGDDVHNSINRRVQETFADLLHR